MKLTEKKEDAASTDWQRSMLPGGNAMSHRRYQSGSLKEDGDRWEIRWREDVRDPFTGTVRRVRKWDTLSKKLFPTKRLAQRELDRRLAAVNAIDYKPMPAEKFEGFAERWKKTVMVHHKPSTQSAETSDIKVHLLPAFGRFHMRDISAEAVQAWVSSLTVGPKTAANLVSTFRTMWKTAKAWGYATHDPFAGLRLQSFEQGNVYYFTIEEAVAIIAEAKGWHKTFFRLMAETGIRPGEAAGVRVQDVGERSVRIAQSVWRGRIQTPKTKNAIREFAMSVDLAAEIRKHIEESPENSYGLVFVNVNREPIKMEHFADDFLDPILEKLGIRAKAKAQGLRVGFYAFRHMNGTVMDKLNTPLKTRQKRFGHADIKTTLTHYTAALDADDLAASENIGALLNPTAGGTVQ